MFPKILLLLCSVHFSHAGVWFHVGDACIGTKGDAFAELTYNGPSSFTGSVKLVHTAGYVANKVSHSGSFWGANAGLSLGTLITDTENKIMYPSPRITKIYGHGWYNIPGYNGISPELIFSDFCAPEYFKKGRKVRVWYGEDLSGTSESDNHGKSCMQVYFYIM